MLETGKQDVGFPAVRPDPETGGSVYAELPMGSCGNRLGGNGASSSVDSGNTASFPFPVSRFRAFTGNQETWRILVASEAAMFDRKRANEILMEVWDREKALPVEEVMAALQREGQGRRTTTVLEAIKRFQKGLEDDAFPATGAPAEKGFIGRSAAQASSSPKKTTRRKAETSGGKTETPNLGNELARLKREAAETAERLDRLEQRVVSLETDDIGLWHRVRFARPRQIEAFWSRVSTTVSEIMQSHDSRTLYDILEMIPQEIVQESIRISVPLNYETLSEKMSVPVPSESEWREIDPDEK